MTRRIDTKRIILFAREDALDTVRERQAHVLVVLFAIIGGATGYNLGRYASAMETTTDFALSTQLLGLFKFLIPIVTLGYVAPVLVEKRASGALTVLLGLPFSRRTVVLGTLFGRCIVIGGASLLAILVALAIGVAMGAPIAVSGIVGVAIAVLVLVVTFAAMGVAISTTVRTSTRATVAAFGAFFIFVLDLWRHLPVIILYVINGLEFPDTVPTWVEFVGALNPMTAFTNVGLGVFPDLFDATQSTNPAFYEEPPFAAIVVFAWIVGTVGLGYYRFRTTDI